MWFVIAVIGGFAAQLRADWPPPIPSELVLRVRNTTDFSRSGEIVRGGVPMPRERALLNTNGLAVVDDQGVAVPASFRILARWNAALSDNAAPIQWLLVRFPATLSAQQSRNYRLRIDGSVANPAPPQPLQLTTVGSQITIDTGVAVFQFGANAAQPFDQIALPGAITLSSASSLSATVDGGLGAGFATIRRIVVEQSDALVAVVIVEGEYAHAAIGGGAISGGRRLEFAAGSAGVNVREWIDWEGARCAIGTLDCGAELNALALQQWRIALPPAFAQPRVFGLRATLAAPTVTANATAGSTGSLRQRLRADRLQAQRFELDLPAQSQVTGVRADAGIAMLAGSAGTLGLALKRMPDYEPQALRLLADGSLAADLADAPVWLGAQQGAFAEYRVSAFAPSVTAAQVSNEMWPALNAPLLALPAAQWIAASQATDEFPVGTLPAELADYDIALNDLIARTQTLRRDRGLEGLMTFGLFPRTWGSPILSEEIDCGDDPTPLDDSDDPYWCGFWTDYHNTVAISWVHAWRSGDPNAVHALAQPAALRQLHTQMIRCAPGDAYFYCGQLPTGYGGYRADFNSSHQYVENLILSYWLSGDRTIFERLQRGASTMRGYLCPARGGEPPGPVCAPTATITDEYAGFNDRVATQFYQIFRFVGLASADASYLDDWRSNVARALTQNIALVNSAGGELGFTEPSGAGTFSYITGPGTYDSTQLWMASTYDMNGLYRLQVDTTDATFGSPPITTSRVRQGWARTLLRASQIPPGDGSAAGVWPNVVRYTFSGARIGGTLTALQPGWAPAPAPDCGADQCLYPEGKSTLSATLARSADDLDDAAMRTGAEDLVEFTLQNLNAQPVPMSKPAGEYFGRLTSAVARLALIELPLFADGFE